MKTFLWTSLFRILLIIGLILYVKLYNPLLSGRFASFWDIDAQNEQFMANSTGIDMINAKVDTLLSGMDILLMQNSLSDFNDSNIPTIPSNRTQDATNNPIQDIPSATRSIIQEESLEERIERLEQQYQTNY